MVNGVIYKQCALNLMAYLRILKICTQVVATIYIFLQIHYPNTRLRTMVKHLATKKHEIFVVTVKHGSLIRRQCIHNRPAAPTKGQELPSRMWVVVSTSMMSWTTPREKLHLKSNFIDHQEGTKRNGRRLHPEKQVAKT